VPRLDLFGHLDDLLEVAPQLGVVVVEDVADQLGIGRDGPAREVAEASSLSIAASSAPASRPRAAQASANERRPPQQKSSP
jgi:hypothetical protein